MSKYPGNIITTGADTGYSVFFDGAGDYLSVANNAAFASLNGVAWTVECWAYATSTASNACIIGNSVYSPGAGFNVFILSGAINLYANGGGSTIVGSTFPTNQWNHVAVVRNSAGQVALFLNGVRQGASNPYTINLTNVASNPLVVGGITTTTGWNSDVYFTGYISNARVVKGAAIYDPTQSTISPLPTQLFNVTNTSLLTCNSPAIVDQGTANSGSGFPITVNGNAAVSTFTPFAGYRAYNPSAGAATPGVWTLSEAMQAAQSRQWNMYDPYFRDTVLALRSGPTDGSQNNTFLDSSNNGFSITRNPTTGPNAITQGTFTPFSPTGWSVYTNSDRQSWVSISSASLALGTGDFDISFYMYYINGTYIMGTGNTAGSWAFTSDGSFRRNTLAADFITGAAPARRWNKIRCVRVSGTTSLYVNDVLRGSLADTQNYTNSNLGIGNFTQGAGGSPNFASEVYISNLKIIKAGTTILDTFRNNRYVDNSPTPLTVTPNANATFQPPFLLALSPLDTNTAYSPALHGGSGYFDGTDDYLTVTQAVTNFYTALGDWEMEAWVYPLSFSGPQYSATIFNFGNGATDDLLFRADVTSNVSTTINLYVINSAGSPAIGASGTSSATAVLHRNQWAHVVVNRISGVFNVWVNGTRVINVTDKTTEQIRTTGNNTFNIGKSYAGSPAGIWNGYISGVKIRTGTTSYSGATITVPTTPPTPTNASFLCNFTNAAIFDATGKNVVETVGNAQASVSVKNTRLFGPPPTTMYFDGTGDYLLIPTIAQSAAIGNGNWTVEFWFYSTITTFSNWRIMLDFRPNTTNGAYMTFSINSAAKPVFYAAAAERIVGDAIVSNQWYHMAVVKNSGSTRMYINGVQVGSAYTDTNTYLDSGRIIVGGGAYTLGTEMFLGYINDLRVTRGVAKYLTNFTPPTSLTQNQ